MSVVSVNEHWENQTARIAIGGVREYTRSFIAITDSAFRR